MPTIRESSAHRLKSNGLFGALSSSEIYAPFANPSANSFRCLISVVGICCSSASVRAPRFSISAFFSADFTPSYAV